MSEFKEPSEILDGADQVQDLHILVGYVWAEGNQKRTFPAGHFIDVIGHYVTKHGVNDE